MRKRSAAAALALLAVAFFWLSRAAPVRDGLPEAFRPDPQNGARLFHLGGCASCHATPGEEASEPPVLGGGLSLDTRFGRFVAPNISPDPEFGIGAWTREEFIGAMRHGVAPDGRHYYPAFPYPSYARMTSGDVLDLKAYLDGLPPSARPSGRHELRFPYSLRRGVGIWKRLYLRREPVRAVDEGDAVLVRGRYLVEGPGHCGECHTPRDAFGGPVLEAWLQGAPSLEGEGRVPDITGGGGLARWSQADIAYYLASGIDPDFDVVGGSMVRVQENLARLPEADRAAIAAYLKSPD